MSSAFAYVYVLYRLSWGLLLRTGLVVVLPMLPDQRYQQRHRPRGGPRTTTHRHSHGQTFLEKRIPDRFSNLAGPFGNLVAGLARPTIRNLAVATALRPSSTPSADRHPLALGRRNRELGPLFLWRRNLLARPSSQAAETPEVAFGICFTRAVPVTPSSYHAFGGWPCRRAVQRFLC